MKLKQSRALVSRAEQERDGALSGRRRFLRTAACSPRGAGSVGCWSLRGCWLGEVTRTEDPVGGVSRAADGSSAMGGFPARESLGKRQAAALRQGRRIGPSCRYLGGVERESAGA